MVKRLYVILDDDEYNELLKAKGRKTWKEFFIELLKFKQRVEEGEEVVAKEAIKEPYVDVARALRRLGALVKVTYSSNRDAQYHEDWEYEAAALLPLFIANEELSEEEKRRLGLIAVNVLWQILEELHPAYSEELKWLVQALRMLAKGRADLYDLSIANFVEAWSRRREGSSSH